MSKPNRNSLTRKAWILLAVAYDPSMMAIDTMRAHVVSQMLAALEHYDVYTDARFNTAEHAQIVAGIDFRLLPDNDPTDLARAPVGSMWMYLSFKTFGRRLSVAFGERTSKKLRAGYRKPHMISLLDVNSNG